MSNKEMCVNILNELSENQLAFVVPMLQTFKDKMEDLEDDLYCESLYRAYLADPDRGEFYTLDECKREWGLA